MKLWALAIYAGITLKPPVLQEAGYIDEQTCYDTAGRAAQIIADKTKARQGDLWFLCVPIEGPSQKDAVWPWLTPPTPSIAEEVRKANLAAAAAEAAAASTTTLPSPTTAQINVPAPGKKP